MTYRPKYLGWLTALLLGLLAADLGPPVRAEDLTWGIKYQPDDGRSPVLYAIRYNRPQCRELYYRQYLKRRRALDPNASMERTPEVGQAVLREFRADCDAIFEILAKSTKMYGEWGLKPPALEPIHDQNGKAYLPVILEDFGRVPVNMPKIAGRVVRTLRDDGSPGEFCVLRLNAYRMCVYRYKQGSIASFLPTVPHELFHSIQWNYCPTGEFWLKESTAVWAANAVVRPQYSHVEHMNRFLLYVHLPLTFDIRDPQGGYLKLSNHGHPYGAAAWFHFLNRQRPADSRRIVIDALTRHHHERNTTALNALGGALGDTSPLGPKFRELYDRFAVGALLTVDAPENCRIEGQEDFSASRAELMRRHAAVPGNPLALTGEFGQYHDQFFEAPESAALEVAFADGNPTFTDRRLTLPQTMGRIGGCGSRYYEVAVPNTAPESAALDVFVKAAEDELSLQGVWHDTRTYHIEPGKYDATAGGYRLHLPVKGVEARRFNLVLTRYSDEERMKPYPIRLACGDPPTVRSVKVTQGTAAKEILSTQWSDQAAAGGGVADRLPATTGSGKFDPAAGSLHVRIEFTSPVMAGDAPICTLGGQTVALSAEENDRVYTGHIPALNFTGETSDKPLVIRAQSKLPGTKIALPLDANPTTVARLSGDLSDWQNYERDRPLELKLKPATVKRELTYRGLMFDGNRLWKPNEVSADNRKVTVSSAFVFIELDTAIVGGKLSFAKEREPGSSSGKPQLDRYDADLFSHVSYGWKLPETARGLVLLHGDAKFKSVDEDGPSIWGETFSFVLYRGDDLEIPGYPEFKKHFLVVFNHGKPTEETREQVLKADRDHLPASVRAVLVPIEK